MTVVDVAHTVFKKLKRLGHILIEPLRVDDELKNFRLSIPETQTTTVDGDIGWGKRPPAALECPRCSSEIHQIRPMDTIDCPRCVAELSHEQFPELELLYLRCPVCRNRMQHGTRHPEALDIPEWATCDHCRYHWEFQHF
jgi:Zn finger protein HypA/HybF involved in hydrogenase expression